MFDFIRGVIAVTVDIARSVGEAVWHERDCDLLIDSAWPCNCRRKEAWEVANARRVKKSQEKHEKWIKKRGY